MAGRASAYPAVAGEVMSSKRLDFVEVSSRREVHHGDPTVEPCDPQSVFPILGEQTGLSRKTVCAVEGRVCWSDLDWTGQD